MTGTHVQLSQLNIPFESASAEQCQEANTNHHDAAGFWDCVDVVETYRSRDVIAEKRWHAGMEDAMLPVKI